MALNDDAVLTAAVGYVYLAPEDTAAPTPAEIEAFTAAVPGLPVGYVTVGHTSRDDLPEFGFDGGDTEAKGTWQNSALRTVVTDPAVDFVTFTLHQFDEASLALYYGQANQSATVGEFSVNTSGGITRKALLIVIVDGDTNLAFYAPRTDIKREDAIANATDEFSTLPLRATLIGGGAVLLSWISSDTGVNPS